MNDADVETLELQGAAQDARNGVCSICDEALNPLDPKWAGTYTNPRYTAQDAAECVGPAHPQYPYHVNCLS